MSEQNQPYVGQNICFTLPSKEVTSAVVTRVKGGNRIDMTLFNNTDTGEFRNNSIQQNVAYSEDANVPGTWHHTEKLSESRQAARA